MIRDMSRIFTVLEEREPFDETDSGSKMSPSNNEITPPSIIAAFRKTSVPFDDRFTPPPARLSLPVGAVTPGTLGKVLHAKRLSICAQRDVEEVEEPISPETPEESIFRHSPIPESPSESKSAPLSPLKPRSQSLEDLGSQPIPMRGYSFGLPKFTQTESPKEEQKQSKPGALQRLFNTITDPNYPVFNANGLPMSQSLFNKYLEQHYCELNEEGKVQKIKSPERKKTAKPDLVALTTADEKEPQADPVPEVPTPAPLANKDLYKRSMSLPLKSITFSDAPDQPEKSKRKSFVLNREEKTVVPGKLDLFDVPDMVETPGEFTGFPRAAATPGAKVTTPAEFRSFILEKRKKELAANNNKSMEESLAIQQDDMAKAVLYTYGYQGMTLMLLLENQAEMDHDLLLNIVIAT
jgi:hypothetical protein